MGYLNLDVREGVFDDIGASGIIDGMVGDYEPFPLPCDEYDRWQSETFIGLGPYLCKWDAGYCYDNKE